MNTYIATIRTPGKSVTTLLKCAYSELVNRIFEHIGEEQPNVVIQYVKLGTGTPGYEVSELIDLFTPLQVGAYMAGFRDEPLFDGFGASECIMLQRLGAQHRKQIVNGRRG